MSTASNSTTEDVLRQQLRSLMQKLPPAHKLDPTYKRLLLNGIVTTRKPALPKDKFYKGIGSRLRETVDRYVMENQGKDPFDRIGQRMPLEDDKMRAALTLREFKEHEQTPLLEATLAANVTQYRQGMDEPTRRRHFEGVAIGLQTSKKPGKPEMGNYSHKHTPRHRHQQQPLLRNKLNKPVKRPNWNTNAKKLDNARKPDKNAPLKNKPAKQRNAHNNAHPKRRNKP